MSRVATFLAIVLGTGIEREARAYNGSLGV